MINRRNIDRPIITIVCNTCIYVLRTRIPLIVALQNAGYDVVVITPEDEATGRLAEKGIRHRSIKMSQYGTNPLEDLRTIKEIEVIFRELKPIASLHYTLKPNTFGTIAAHRAGVPVINNIAGLGRAFSSGNPLLRLLVMALYRYALNRSHRVFFQNDEDMLQFFGLELVKNGQCVRIPGSGVDLQRFTPSPLPLGYFRFLFVGRLLREKGIAEFLEAASILLASTAPGSVRFEVIGEHENESGYISRADLNRLTSPDEVAYHGVVTPDRVYDVMRAATCVVLPSYYREGVPRVLLEACASGRPIITTDNVGCRDVIVDGKNGFMVPIRSAIALADAMRRIMKATPEQLKQMSEFARQTAENRFDENIVIDTYLREITQLNKVASA